MENQPTTDQGQENLTLREAMLPPKRERLESKAQREGQTREAVSLLLPLRDGEPPGDAASGLGESPGQRRSPRRGWSEHRADGTGRRGAFPERLGRRPEAEIYLH